MIFPISLSSNNSKFFKKINKKELVNYLENNNLGNTLFGFRLGKSTKQLQQ